MKIDQERRKADPREDILQVDGTLIWRPSNDESCPLEGSILLVHKRKLPFSRRGPLHSKKKTGRERATKELGKILKRKKFRIGYFHSWTSAVAFYGSQRQGQILKRKRFRVGYFHS
ncbi:hypothetical protein [Leptospira stimsonii]|uniref:Uncharacterized protein n=1 Tax=Leptospira stimsonii TaxID=2202203 RepID=A0A396Z765_9LEPT|nr:hypothetical protein [Leptospira stimsonii]RHX89953.1 hypothetical protein DLM75_13480 [Leptospira stimsonii]